MVAKKTLMRISIVGIVLTIAFGFQSKQDKEMEQAELLAIRLPIEVRTALKADHYRDRAYLSPWSNPFYVIADIDGNGIDDFVLTARKKNTHGKCLIVLLRSKTGGAPRIEYLDADTKVFSIQQIEFNIDNIDYISLESRDWQDPRFRESKCWRWTRSNRSFSVSKDEAYTGFLRWNSALNRFEYLDPSNLEGFDKLVD